LKDGSGQVVRLAMAPVFRMRRIDLSEIILAGGCDGIGREGTDA
jgi:hypothetical protein